VVIERFSDFFLGERGGELCLVRLRLGVLQRGYWWIGHGWFVFALVGMGGVLVG